MAASGPSSNNAAAAPDETDTKESVAADGQVQSDTSKLRTFLSILKRFIGVTDIAAVRFSLPAQLLEPIPNLEYWHYLDRPETFAAIGDSDDGLERMLAVLRFWFTKDLKYIKGRPCKPYNSALGEFFRCSWDVEQKEAGTAASSSPLRVHYLTEQTSHHPPVSAFVYECPEKGISAVGYDQLSAKFTGTSVKVTPGQYNKGIFLTLHNRNNEEYQLTHPAAYLSGFLRGNLYITVADTCYITCAKTGLKTILHYVEESYFGKTQNRVEGVIYRPVDLVADSITKLKDVPRDTILARVDGNWTDKIFVSYGNTEPKKVAAADKQVFLDLAPLVPATKTCPPPAEQLPNESRRFWNDVTEAILAKQYSQATNKKTQLEERQRERAAERAARNQDWQPRFFATVVEDDGRAVLSQEGLAALQGLKTGEYHLEPPKEYGAI